MVCVYVCQLARQSLDFSCMATICFESVKSHVVGQLASLALRMDYVRQQ